MYKTSNIAISNLKRVVDSSVIDRSTYKGVAIKAIYFGLVTILATIVSIFMLQYAVDIMGSVLIGALIGSLIFGIIAAFAPKTIPTTGTLYCLSIGILLGAISYVIDQVYSGVVPLALVSTVIVFCTVSILYATGLIRVSNRFRSTVYSMLFSIIVIGIVVSLITTFSSSLRELFYGNSLLSIGISIFMVFFASFLLICDISQIHEMVTLGLDKKYEWRAAYGLVITIIWLYLEFLQLFSKISSRSK